MVYIFKTLTRLDKLVNLQFISTLIDSYVIEVQRNIDGESPSTKLDILVEDGNGNLPA